MHNKILITGGAGFIGSHLTRLFVTKYPNYTIVNLDKLTYAGNLENLTDIENAPNYTFVKGDITDLSFLRELFVKYNFTRFEKNRKIKTFPAPPLCLHRHQYTGWPRPV